MNEIFKAMSNPLLSPIVVALVLGALAYVFSRWSVFFCKLLALSASGIVLAGGLAIHRYHAGASVQWLWEMFETITVPLQLAHSGLGMIVVIGSGAFGLLITIYSIRAMAGQYWEGKFYAYLIWTLAGACVVGLAQNLLVLLVGWELVTLMLFLMVNQGPRDAKAGGAKAYGMLGFADACLLLAIVLLVRTKGGFDALTFPATPVPLAASGMGAVGYIVYVLILIAALAKAGAIPLHSWIPAIAADAPAPVLAYLPASLDKLMGIYLLAVLALRMFTPDWTLSVIMMVIGAVTILAAVLMAMMQHNLKKLLSFHAVSQVGYMVLGIGTGTAIGIIGGLFHMVNNAIYKCCLFLVSGTAGRAAGSDEIEEMGGLARFLPITFVCGAVAAAAISGIPPFNGFASKWLVYQGTLSISRTNAGLAIALVVAAVFGSALTLASFVKVLYSAFLSPAPKAAAYLRRPPRESFFLAAPMIVLAAACIVLGLGAGWMTEGILKPAIEPFVGREAMGDLAVTVNGLQAGEGGLWNPPQATVLILLGILIGMVLVYLAMVGSKVRVVRPFLAGEVAAPGDGRFRVPGTHFYETIAKLPIIGPLLGHGERGAMDLYHWSSRHGQTFVEVLRSRHTGLISLYVAWVLVGLTVTLLYLLLSMRA